MSYRNMTKLACFIAPAKMDEWERSDIENMVESCGSEATYDFLNAYQSKFGINLEQQISWVLDMDATNGMLVVKERVRGGLRGL